jgi:hypothetical protein
MRLRVVVIVRHPGVAMAIVWMVIAVVRIVVSVMMSPSPTPTVVIRNNPSWLIEPRIVAVGVPAVATQVVHGVIISGVVSTRKTAIVRFIRIQRAASIANIDDFAFIGLGFFLFDVGILLLNHVAFVHHLANWRTIRLHHLQLRVAAGESECCGECECRFHRIPPRWV